MYENFKLFDRYDYQRLGLLDNWYLGNVIQMLVSFYMQTNGLCSLVDAPEHQIRLYDNYESYLFNLISYNKLTYTTVYQSEDDFYDYQNDIHIGTDITLLNKYELLEYLEDNNLLKLDMNRLRKFLSWDEFPEAPTKPIDVLPPSNEPKASPLLAPSEHDGSHASVQDAEPQACVKTPTIENKNNYRFEKTAQSWDIHFGDEILRGVKDYVGMQYIKLLLQNPDNGLDVIEMQAMLNVKSINVSIQNKSYGQDSNGMQDEQEDIAQSFNINTSHVYVSKYKQLSILQNKLKELEKYRAELKDYDFLEIEKIDKDADAIEAEIDNIKYGKSDDPEIEANRKKIFKNIDDTLKNIKALEEKSGHTDVPIYNFLKQYITTGIVCEYVPPKENPPSWTF